MTFIYLLQLETNKYYIGKSTDVEKRVLEHFNNSSAAWTKKI